MPEEIVLPNTTDQMPERSSLEAFLCVWYSVLGSHETTTGELLRLAQEPTNVALREAFLRYLPYGSAQISPKSLGRYLHFRAGQVHGHYQLARGFDRHAKQATWAVIDTWAVPPSVTTEHP